MAWYAIVQEASMCLSLYFVFQMKARSIRRAWLLEQDDQHTKLLWDFISLLNWRTCSLTIRPAPMQKRWIFSISSLSLSLHLSPPLVPPLSLALSRSSSFLFFPSDQRFKISDPIRSMTAKQLQEKRKSPTPTGSPVLTKTSLAGCFFK